MKNKSMDAFIVLRNGKQVPVSFSLWILLQIEAAIPQLKRDKEHTARELCGEGFWSLLIRGERNLVGECIAFMVIQGDLPLINVGRSGENHQLYRLK